VKRGEVLGDLKWIRDWDSDLERMNAGKKGRPYEFPNSLFVYCMKQMCHKNLTYRMPEGDLRCILGELGKKTPDHSTIEERCSVLDWALEPSVYPQTVSAAVDSTGIGTTVRGEWLRDVYHVKRGFVKLHALTDTETDAILSYALTDSGTTDGSIALLLVDAAVGLGYDIGKAFMDAAYDHKEIWKGLMERKIEPVINLRANDVHANGCLYKGEMIDERDKFGPEAWKKNHGYGVRWRIECAFSGFKRTLGGSVRAKKLTRITKELSCKICIHNTNKKYRGQ
jgi:hypothetical protein